jgi:hypothetical protein
MPSPRHPAEFRRTFVDALSLCHVESVVLVRSDPEDEHSPLIPARRPGAGRTLSGRTISIQGYARRALAHQYTAALDSIAGLDFRGVEPRSGVPYNDAYRLLDPHDGGGPRVAEFFMWRSPTTARFDVGGVWRGGGPRGSVSSGMQVASELVAIAMDTWRWLDANAFVPLDATLAAEARAAVATARASYVSWLNAKFGEGTYV